jgi:hypothetical protein
MSTRPWPRFGFFALVAACSGQGGGPATGTSSGVAAGDFAAAFADAICEALAGCCANAGTPIDRNACIMRMTLEGGSVLRATSASRTYDPVGAGQCIEGTRSIFASCVMKPPNQQEFTEICRHMYVGTVEVGGRCNSDNDCADSDLGIIRCEPVGPAISPPNVMCVVDPPGQIGEVCRSSVLPIDFDQNLPAHLSCAEGLYCDGTNHCQPRLPEGAPCVLTEQCASTLWCSPGGINSTNSSCVPRASLGTACALDQTCTSGTCYQSVCAPGVPISCTF